MRSLLMCSLLLAGILAGCAGSDKPEPTDVVPNPDADTFVPHVVVGILDTGPIPYHQEFRQLYAGTDASAYPGTYLTGYPEGAQELPITLAMTSKNGDEITDAEAYLEADAAIWSATKAEQLYWIPGTRFIGFIGFDVDLPGGGHGSMTASRAGGNTISINDGEVLLLEAVTPLSLPLPPAESPEARATKWMADQPFIDIQSHSWGWPVTCGGVATTFYSGWAEAFKYARDRQLVLVATANGHGNTGTLGYPSQCQDNAGIAGIVSVGGTDNAGYPTWANWFPAVAADGCGNPAVDETTTDTIANTGSGTSSATPFTAGGAAKLLLEARRIFRDPNVGVHDGVMATAQPGAVIPTKGPLADGKFTMDEMKDVLYHTAVFPPTVDDSDGDDCAQNLPVGALPHEAAFAFVGYGEVNRDSIAHGVAVLKGEETLAAAPTLDQIYTNDQAVRQAYWG